MNTKTCMFCNLEWVVSALDKSTNYTCPRCEKFLATHRGKVLRRNKNKHAK